MNPARPPLWLPLLAGLSICAGLGAWGLHALARLLAENALDPFEATVAFNTRWAAQGLNIYAADPHAFPFPNPAYPPLFAWLAAPLEGCLFPSGFLAVRFISLLSTGGAAALLFSLLRQRAVQPLLSLLASLLFLLCGPTWEWTGYGRVDFLALFFDGLGVFWFFRYRETPARWRFAVLFWLAAGFTKQTMAGAFLSVLIFLVMDKDRRAIFLGAGVLGSAVLLLGLAQALSGGHFFWYMVNANVPPFSSSQLSLLLERMMSDPLWLAVCCLSLPVVFLKEARFEKVWLAVAWSIGLLGSVNEGAAVNTYLPAVLVQCLALGLVLDRLFKSLHPGAGVLTVSALVISALFSRQGLLAADTLVFDPARPRETGFLTLKKISGANPHPLLFDRLDLAVRMPYEPALLDLKQYNYLSAKGFHTSDPLGRAIAGRRFPAVILTGSDATLQTSAFLPRHRTLLARFYTQDKSGKGFTVMRPRRR